MNRKKVITEPGTRLAFCEWIPKSTNIAAHMTPDLIRARQQTMHGGILRKLETSTIAMHLLTQSSK